MRPKKKITATKQAMSQPIENDDDFDPYAPKDISKVSVMGLGGTKMSVEASDALMGFAKMGMPKTAEPQEPAKETPKPEPAEISDEDELVSAPEPKAEPEKVDSNAVILSHKGLRLGVDAIEYLLKRMPQGRIQSREVQVIKLRLDTMKKAMRRLKELHSSL